MNEYRVRAATAADAAVICRIYNQGIEDRLATLETELRTPEERAAWLAAKGPRHPVIVAETTESTGSTESTKSTKSIVAESEPRTTSNRPPTPQAGRTAVATVIAWGSLNQFNPREAYRHVVDFSIYVERAYRGRGVGKVLLDRLIELAREHRYHKMVLSAFPSNRGGMALYERMGFRTVGVYKEQGMLDGRWVDTIVMEKLL